MSRYLNLLLRFGIAALLAAGCGLAPALVTDPAIPTGMNSPQPSPPLTATLTLPPAATLPLPPAATVTPAASPTPLPIARRVLVLSIDGLRPDIIRLAPMYNLQALLKTSAYTLSAQTIYPSATLPSHASMLLAA